MLRDFYDQWSGLIPIVGGIYALLLANGVLSRKPSNPEKLDRWRRKAGSTLNVVAPVIILFGVLELLGVTGHIPKRPVITAEDIRDSLTVHRTVNDPDSDGWYTAVSTEGSFSVRLPVPCNDGTMRIPDDEGRITKGFIVAGKSSEGLRLTATEYSKPPVNGDVSGFVETMRDSLADSPRYSTIGGFDSVELHVVRKTDGAYIRYVDMRDRWILMILEYPDSQEKLAADLADTFLMSLELTQPAK